VAGYHCCSSVLLAALRLLLAGGLLPQVPAGHALALRMDCLCDLLQDGVKVVGLHLSPADHPGDDLVVYPVLCGARAGGQEVGDDDPDLLLEGVKVVQLGDYGAAGLARLWLAEVDDKIALVDLVGCTLVVCLLASVNIKCRIRFFRNKADLGHNILNQSPGAFVGVVIAEGDGPAGLEDTVALS